MCNEPFGSKSAWAVLRNNRLAFLIFGTATEIGVYANSVPPSSSRDFDCLLLIPIKGDTRNICRTTGRRV